MMADLAPVYTRRRPPTSKFVLGPVFPANFLTFRARGYSTGPIILTKVVLGKVYDTSAGFVRSCPNGYDSVSMLPTTD
jgi:hypothetical protein